MEVLCLEGEVFRDDGVGGQAAEGEAAAWYLDFRTRLGARPTASEFAHAGFAPDRTGHGGWFDFVRDMGDPIPQAASDHMALLQSVEKGSFTDAAPLVALLALIPDLQNGETQDRLIQKSAIIALRRDLSIDPNRLGTGWAHWAISPEFRVVGDRLALRRRPAEGLSGLLTELADWQVSEAVGTAPVRPEFDRPSIQETGTRES